MNVPQIMKLCIFVELCFKIYFCPNNINWILPKYYRKQINRQNKTLVAFSYMGTESTKLKKNTIRAFRIKQTKYYKTKLISGDKRHIKNDLRLIKNITKFLIKYSILKDKINTVKW